jgi:hypothetical protein
MVAHADCRIMQSPSHILGFEHDICHCNCPFLIVRFKFFYQVNVLRTVIDFCFAANEERKPKFHFGARKRANI